MDDEVVKKLISALGGIVRGAFAALAMAFCAWTAWGADTQPDAVQLWEGGPYWATCNVGATKPEESGYFFWWGDTVGYTNNGSAWISVKDGTSIKFDFDKSPANSTHNMEIDWLQREGYLSESYKLTAAHDAATAHLGPDWRMPTKEDFEGLMDDTKCDINFIGYTTDGMDIYEVRGKGAFASNSILFYPYGYGEGDRLNTDEMQGFFWSSTVNSGDSGTAWYFISDYRLDFGNEHRRAYGLTVRAVRDTPPTPASEPVAVTVTITGFVATNVYDGVGHSVTGYVFSASDPLYKEEYVTFTGASNAVRTAVGTTTYLATNEFANTSSAFSVTFEVVPGEITITPRSVTLTSATESFEYDGNAHSNTTITVSGDGFVGEEGVTTNGFATITEAGTNANTFAWEFLPGTLATNYNVSVVTGELAVTASTAPITVTITGSVATNAYDGVEHGVTGYVFTASNPLYKEEYVTFTGVSNAVRTAQGTTTYLAASDFANVSPAFSDVTFEVVPGEITITKAEIVPTGDDAEPQPTVDPVPAKPEGGASIYDVTVMYDGEGHTINTDALETATLVGATPAFAYSIDGTTWTDEAPAYTNAGEYAISYKVSDPDGNYDDFVHAAKLTITNRCVTLTSATESFEYDGNAHSNTTITVSGDGFVGEEGVTTDGFVTITEVGTNANTFAWEFLPNTLATNYNVSVVTGDLVVTASTAPVTVTITGSVATNAYDGAEHGVTGYVFTASNPLYTEEYVTFTGTSNAVRTAQGTTTYLAASDFANASPAFSDVTFEVVPGEITITKAEIVPTGDDAEPQPTVDPVPAKPEGGASIYDVTVMYDGEGHTINTDALETATLVGATPAFAYSVDGTTWTDEAPVYTNAGEYAISYKVSDPAGNYDDFVHAAKLTITNRCVTLTSATESFEYDGNAHSNTTITVSGDGFVAGEGVTTDGFVTITEVGTNANAFAWEFLPNTLATNYNVSVVTGELAVTAVDPTPDEPTEPEFLVDADGTLTNIVLNGATELSVPTNVTAIADGAFADCGGVTNLTFNGNAPVASTNALAGLNADCVIHAPDSSTGWDVAPWTDYTLDWAQPEPPEPGPEPPEPESLHELFPNGDETPFADAVGKAAKWHGWLADTNGIPVGTIEVKTTKMNKRKGTVSITATVKRFDSTKRETYRAKDIVVPETGALVETLQVSRGTDSLTLGFSGRELVGVAKNGFNITGSRDLYRRGEAGRTVVDTLRKLPWTAAIRMSGDHPLANGWATIQAKFSSTGRCRVKGVFPDLWKPSVSAYLSVGDGWTCVPVSFRRKTGGALESFGFLLWIASDGSVREIEGITDWSLPVKNVGVVPAMVAAEPVIGHPKLDKNGFAALTIEVEGMPSEATAPKFRFSPRTGVVTGSFKITPTDGNRKATVSVNGVEIDGSVYGTATIKGVAAQPVTSR